MEFFVFFMVKIIIDDGKMSNHFDHECHPNCKDLSSKSYPVIQLAKLKLKMSM